VGLEPAFLVSSCCAATYTKNINSLQCVHNWTYKIKKLDNVKIDNLKRKNRDHKKVPKQDEDTYKADINIF